MIKSVQKKFIIIAIISVAIVLALIMSTINIYNYVKLKNNADDTISQIIETKGSMNSRDYLFGNNYFSYFFNIPNSGIQSIYFSVTINSNGTIIDINTQNTEMVSNEEASEMAHDLFSKNKYSGFYQVYRYGASYIDGNLIYVFLDCSSELSTFARFFVSSILISIIGVVLVFLLILLFSKRFLKPVYESYNKQKQFITDAGHELKTPLTIIDANTEIIEMEHGEDEWTKSIKNQVSRMSTLTENLIYLSRMEEENSLVQKTDFSLSDAVYETAYSFSAVAETHGKFLQIDIEKNITYCGDESSIRRLISILLDNAIKYSNENGMISISLKMIGKQREINVFNTVENIEIGNLDKLFDRFYRSDSSHNSQTGGCGIGLASARAIVNAHKGKIKAKSADGKSILITISL